MSVETQKPFPESKRRRRIGVTPGVRESFSLLEFPDPDDPPVAYIETYDAAQCVLAADRLELHRWHAGWESSSAPGIATASPPGPIDLRWTPANVLSASGPPERSGPGGLDE
jgi:hypothetical protein